MKLISKKIESRVLQEQTFQLLFLLFASFHRHVAFQKVFFETIAQKQNGGDISRRYFRCSEEKLRL